MKDLLSSSVAFVLSALLNLATGVLAARLLGPDGRGELAVIVLWPQLVATIGIALVTDAVVHASADRTAPYPRIFASAMACALLLTVPLVALGLFIESFVYGHYQPEVAALGRLYLLYIPVTMLATFAAAIFQGSLNFVAWNALNVFVSAAYLCFITLLLLGEAVSLRGFAISSLLANGATLLLAFTLLAKRGWVGFRPDPALMRRFLIYGAPIAAAHLLIVAGERLDQAVISQLRGERELGLYAVALGMSGPILGLGALLGALVLPKVTHQTTLEGRVLVLARYLRLSVIAAFLGAIAVIVLAPLAVRILFGAAFLPAASLVQVIMLAVVPCVIRRLLAQAFKAYDKTRLVFRMELITVAIGAASLFVLVPWQGAMGAAWTYVIVNSFGAVYSIVLARKALGLKVRALFRVSADDWQLLRQELAGLRTRRDRGAVP